MLGCPNTGRLSGVCCVSEGQHKALVLLNSGARAVPLVADPSLARVRMCRTRTRVSHQASQTRFTVLFTLLACLHPHAHSHIRVYTVRMCRMRTCASHPSIFRHASRSFSLFWRASTHTHTHTCVHTQAHVHCVDANPPTHPHTLPNVAS